MLLKRGETVPDINNLIRMAILVNQKFNFPVDAVYTWVDGNDPVWARRKAEAQATANQSGGTLDESSLAECRFLDNEELRYSLRSLARHAPWIRNVYLITDRQRPTWINPEQITVVDHRDIFPDFAVHPAFNSHVIELCQHRIEGLSEHFLSFNDDFMIGRDIRIDQFFDSQGGPIIWVVKKSKTHRKKLLTKDYVSLTPHSAADIRARRMIYEKYNIYLPYRVRHYPRPMLRSGMEKIWETFEEEVRITLKSQFRSVDDVAIHVLFSFYVLAEGLGKARVINGAQQLLDIFLGRLHHLGASVGDANYDKKVKHINMVNPLTFCLNDSLNASTETRMAMGNFLQSRFPEACKYEAQAVPVLKTS